MGRHIRGPAHSKCQRTKLGRSVHLLIDTLAHVHRVDLMQDVIEPVILGTGGMITLNL